MEVIELKADEDILTIDVGGTKFRTCFQPILRFKDSLLYAKVMSRARKTDSDGYPLVFVDADPTHFRHILNFHRNRLVLPETKIELRELLQEAGYYKLPELEDLIVNKLKWKCEKDIKDRLDIHGRLRTVVRNQLNSSDKTLLKCHLRHLDTLDEEYKSTMYDQVFIECPGCKKNIPFKEATSSSRCEVYHHTGEFKTFMVGGKFFDSKKWTCCSKSERSAKGCKRIDHYFLFHEK